MKKASTKSTSEVAGAKKSAKTAVKSVSLPVKKKRGTVDPQPVAALSGATLVRVPLNRVMVCPLNPRKHVDAAGIDEMARSILAHGIIQPPVARAAGDDYYEVVFGQRRLCGLMRAKEIAREEDLPEPPFEIDLLLRVMDDRTVREESWIENLQRVDLSVREESLGFEELLNLVDEDGKPVYSVTRLAATLGKSTAFISRRLKLRGVPEDLWKALDEEGVGVRQLELVGYLPTQEMRDRAAKDVLAPRFRTSPPLTVKETQVLLKEQYMVSLQGAEWHMKDAELVLEKKDEAGNRCFGGACHDCHLRTGRNPELQASLSDGSGQRGWKGNSCMLPECYRAKKAAAWKRTKAAAVESGWKVLTDEEAKKTFSQWGGDDALERSSGLIALSSRPGYAETGHHAGEDVMPSWEEMIGDKVPAGDVVLARNPHTGAIRKLLPQKLAIQLAEAALKEQGKESPFDHRKKEKTGKGIEPRSEWQLERAVNEQITRDVGAWLRSQAKDGAVLGEFAKEELIVSLAMRAQQEDGAKTTCEALGIAVPESEDMEDMEKKLESEMRRAAGGSSAGGYWWILVELVALICGGVNCYDEDEAARVKRLFEAVGMPIAAIMEAATAAVDAEEKARLKDTKKLEKAA